MSRKLTKLVLAASVAVGFTVAPMLGAYAAERNVFVGENAFQGGNIEGGVPTYDALPGDTIKWHIDAGNHTISPRNEPGYAAWPAEAKGSGELEKGDEFKITFPKAGRFLFGCDIHPDMKGAIDVKDQTTTTTAPPTTTTTTAAPAPPPPTTTTTSAPASSAGAKPPVGTPAPSTTATTKPAEKDKKDKKNKDDKKKEEETTTTTVAPPPPVDIPDSAIIPVLPSGGTNTTTQDGIEAPADTPEGDAIALLSPKRGGSGKAKTLLIVSGVGLGVLALGTAGYKYANRSSKYFPA